MFQLRHVMYIWTLGSSLSCLASFPGPAQLSVSCSMQKRCLHVGRVCGWSFVSASQHHNILFSTEPCCYVLHLLRWTVVFFLEHVWLCLFLRARCGWRIRTRNTNWWKSTSLTWGMSTIINLFNPSFQALSFPPPLQCRLWSPSIILSLYSKKHCKYFNMGNGTCPFGGSCFYRHGKSSLILKTVRYTTIL